MTAELQLFIIDAITIGFVIFMGIVVIKAMG